MNLYYSARSYDTLYINDYLYSSIKQQSISASTYIINSHPTQTETWLNCVSAWSGLHTCFAFYIFSSCVQVCPTTTSLSRDIKEERYVCCRRRHRPFHRLPLLGHGRQRVEELKEAPLHVRAVMACVQNRIEYIYQYTAASYLARDFFLCLSLSHTHAHAHTHTQKNRYTYVQHIIRLEKL